MARCLVACDAGGTMTVLIDWLGRPLPDEKTFENETPEAVRGWSR